MAWHISSALMTEYERSNSLPVQGGGFLVVSSSGKLQSAPSSGSLTPLLYLPDDRMKAFSTRSLSGMTFARLTVDLGEGVLTWFLEAFPVRTSAPQDEEKESPASDPASGKSLPGSLAKYDPNESVWKTHQCSLFEESTLYSGTWPRWGTMRNGEFSERMTPALPTSARGSGFWASPPAADAVGSHGGGQGRSLRTDISEWKKGNWPTPRSHESGDYQRDGGQLGKERPTLSGAVKFWPTPTASTGGPEPEGETGRKLATAVATFPTPKARDWKRSGGNRNTPDLSTFVRGGGMQTPPTYPTPTSVTESGGSALCKWGGSGARKAMSELLPSDEINGALNPEWVEWLMGWPLGWTDLKPLATARFQTWLSSRTRL